MIGRLLLRGTVGGFFIGHGTQKLFGAFGGHGLQGTAQFFEEGLGLHPGKLHATAAGAAETAGGASMLLGAAVPLGAAAITSTMLTAINRVHFKNGPWAADGGYEYNAVLIAAALALTEVGPGPLSVDRLRGREHKGTVWTLAALAAGTAGAVGAHLFAESQKPAEQAPTPPAPTEVDAEAAVSESPEVAGIS